MIITKEQYIDQAIANDSLSISSAAYSYRVFAKFHGARTCNDGYPDARFEATFRPSDLRVRKFIANARNEYEYCLRWEPKKIKKNRWF